MIRFDRWVSVRSFLSVGLGFGVLFPPDRVLAQILPDRTLPQNSTVTTNGNLQRIADGTQTGSNLFHSFSEFNVRTGETAHFDNAPRVENIITRVTGRQLSNIDGILRTNGSANLFLINSNGIHFGANAQLEIGGSFVASTASGVNFADGSEFLTTGGDTPLLTVSVPVGLQWDGSNSGSITSNGANLAVPTGQTLALVGGDIALSGGTLVAGGSPFIEVEGIPTATTLGGRIELGSLRNGEVNFARGDRSLDFNYAGSNDGGAIDFGEIQLRATDVNVTGTGGGDIQIVARNLQMSDLARVISVTQGTEAGGNITVNTTESVELTGTGDFTQTIQQFTSGDATPFNLRVTGLFNLTLGMGNAGEIAVDTSRLVVRQNAAILNGAQGPNAGDSGALSVQAAQRVEVTTAFIATANGVGGMGVGGNLTLSTDRLLLQENGLVLATTLGASRGGDLTVEADTIELTRAQPFLVNPILTFGTTLSTGTLADGDAGDLTVNARTIELSDRAQINSGTIDSGRGGNLTVNASESIELRGGETVRATAAPDNFFNTSITTGTVVVADAGDLRLTTPRLVLRDGAFVATETFGLGRGGMLQIDAETIELSGTSPDGQLPTAISSRSISLLGGGNAGNVRIETNRLSVREGAQVAANSRGSGSAGNLEITATDIQLEGGGELTAATAAGAQGNITLNASAIVLRDGSRITTNSTESASGGNITIDTNTLVALDNSDITANAEESFGGRVSVAARGLFGTAFRENDTPNSDITASSEQGSQFSGTVTINTPDIDPSSGLVELSSSILDVENILARGCLNPSSSQRGRFVILGSGGLPVHPNAPTSFPFETYTIPSRSSALQERVKMRETGAILEAEGVFQLEDDRFVLGRQCSRSDRRAGATQIDS